MDKQLQDQQKSENQIPDLVELSVSLEHKDDLTLVQPHVRFGSSEFDYLDFEVEIQLTSARLQLDALGFSISPKGKFGEKTLSNAVETLKLEQTKASKNETKGGGAGANFSASPDGLSVGAKGRFSFRSDNKKSNTVTEETIRVEHFMRVSALGNDTWKFSEGAYNVPLDGLYLDGSTTLCNLSRPPANRYILESRIYAKKRDFSIAVKMDEPRPSDVRKLINKNKRNIISAYLLKKLSYCNRSSTPNGLIEISASEIETSRD